MSFRVEFSFDQRELGPTGTTNAFTFRVANLSGNSLTILCALPLREASRSFNATAFGGATGHANGTGAINQTLTMPAGSSVLYTGTSTFTPSATKKVTTLIASAQIVGDPTSIQYAWDRTLQGPFGQVENFYDRESQDGEKLRNAFFDFPRERQDVLDFIENTGFSMADLVLETVSPNDRPINAYFPGHATAGTEIDQVIFRAPFRCTVTAVEFTPNTTQAGAATNFFSLKLMNRVAGTGAIEIANRDYVNGVNLTAFTPSTITLSTTPANLDLDVNDVISFRKAVSGTGQPCPAGTVTVHLRPRT